MPRVATTPISRNRRLPTQGGRIPPSPPLNVRCPQPNCPWSFKTQTDLKRHHKSRHMSPEEREKQMYKCPMQGCTHKSLQKSNLETHYNAKHSGLKPHVCKQCTYCAADPSCLHRHMRAVHGYVSGTAPRKSKRRSAAPSPSPSITPALSQPIIPASSSPDYCSDYSEFAMSSWDGAVSPTDSAFSSFPVSSPSSTSSSDEPFAFYSTPPPAPTPPLSPLRSFLPHPPPPDAPLLASPTTWDWDAEFEAAFFPSPTPEKSLAVAVVASPPAMQHPGEGIDFFFNAPAVECSDNTATSAFLLPPAPFDFGVPKDDGLMFFPPPASFPLESSPFCVEDFGFDLDFAPVAVAFEGEWTGTGVVGPC
ncbi:hypothetical protein MVEN_00630800 [Mycena venus]|uniref:C2H2-type domain-containing protein n=1 Tax=Mycena venus TaxID=2733690 RepID=A0A8H6YRV7_9AGAR|nr:hypothetical protein MVEN_00630800 [Mycena venus]